jgi:hypothetical protein
VGQLLVAPKKQNKNGKKLCSRKDDFLSRDSRLIFRAVTQKCEGAKVGPLSSEREASRNASSAL